MNSKRRHTHLHISKQQTYQSHLRQLPKPPRKALPQEGFGLRKSTRGRLLPQHKGMTAEGSAQAVGGEGREGGDRRGAPARGGGRHPAPGGRGEAGTAPGSAPGRAAPRTHLRGLLAILGSQHRGCRQGSGAPQPPPELLAPQPPSSGRAGGGEGRRRPKETSSSRDGSLPPAELRGIRSALPAALSPGPARARQAWLGRALPARTGRAAAPLPPLSCQSRRGLRRCLPAPSRRPISLRLASPRPARRRSRQPPPPAAPTRRHRHTSRRTRSVLPNLAPSLLPEPPFESAQADCRPIGCRRRTRHGRRRGQGEAGPRESSRQPEAGVERKAERRCGRVTGPRGRS